MSGLKKWLNALLGFSRTESNAFIILLPVVTIIAFSEPITRWYISERSDDFSVERATLDSLTSTWSVVKASNSTAVEKEGESVKWFSFDPNKISTEELQQLGFSPALAKRVIKYRTHGGRFRIKSDVKKIYGIDSTLYRNLYPYILLPSVLPVHQTKVTAEKKAQGKTHIRFDINRTDTAELKLVYGIGTTLASRIVKYRNRLGGFVSFRQLNEVYGLDTLAISRLLNASYLADNFEPVRIDINKATQSELESHPYLNRAAAKAIITYRFQHGNVKTVEELGLLPQVKNKDKLIPYLKIESSSSEKK